MVEVEYTWNRLLLDLTWKLLLVPEITKSTLKQSYLQKNILQKILFTLTSVVKVVTEAGNDQGEAFNLPELLPPIINIIFIFDKKSFDKVCDNRKALAKCFVSFLFLKFQKKTSGKKKTSLMHLYFCCCYCYCYQVVFVRIENIN